MQCSQQPRLLRPCMQAQARISCRHQCCINTQHMRKTRTLCGCRHPCAGLLMVIARLGLPYAMHACKTEMLLHQHTALANSTHPERLPAPMCWPPRGTCAPGAPICHACVQDRNAAASAHSTCPAAHVPCVAGTQALSSPWYYFSALGAILDGCMPNKPR